MPGSKGSKTKHDRCVEGVKESNSGVDNPHAVCVSQGVKPSNWKKSKNEECELIKFNKDGQWSLHKRDYNGNLKGGSENSEWTYKDDKAHPPGSPEDQAHDVIELDESLQAEMKDLSPNEKSDMLEHLRNYKKDPQKWKRSKKNIKAGDEKDESGRD